MSFLIEHGLLLTPDDTVLLAWWTEQTTPYMQKVNGIDSSMIDRARMLRRAADRFLEMSQLRHELEDRPAPEASSAANSQPQVITAGEAAEILQVDVRTVYRIRAQLGLLREKPPLVFSHDAVIAYKVRRDNTKRSAA
jgi:hypothetical protein